MEASNFLTIEMFYIPPLFLNPVGLAASGTVMAAGIAYCITLIPYGPLCMVWVPSSQVAVCGGDICAVISSNCGSSPAHWATHKSTNPQTSHWQRSGSILALRQVGIRKCLTLHYHHHIQGQKCRYWHCPPSQNDGNTKRKYTKHEGRGQ